MTAEPYSDAELEEIEQWITEGRISDGVPHARISRLLATIAAIKAEWDRQIEELKSEDPE